MMKPWSDADVVLLKKLWPNRAYRMIDIEARLHKADETIRGMAIHLGLPTRGEAVAVWPEDKVERLKARWAEGASATEIARELGGFTRNAIIGKVTRLGLPKRSRLARLAATTTNRRAQAARRPAAPRAPKPKAHYVKFERTPHIGDGPRPPRAELRARAWTPLEGVPPVRLEDRPGDACRWPINVEAAEGEAFRQHWCCGGHVHANGYCAPHYQLAHQAPRTATEKAADQVRRDKAFSRQRRAA